MFCIIVIFEKANQQISNENCEIDVSFSRRSWKLFSILINLFGFKKEENVTFNKLTTKNLDFSFHQKHFVACWNYKDEYYMLNIHI